MGTLGNIYNNVSFALSLHTEAIARLQEQAATGSRINRASDDPSSAYQVLELNSQKKSLENYIDNLSETISTLEFSSTIIGGENGMTPTLAEVKTCLTQITSGTYSAKQRSDAADRIDELLEQIVSLANTKQKNQYLFGGGNTASAPYIVERTDEKITSVTYQGSLQDRNIEVATGVESSAFHIGENIFRSNDRSDPIFMGSTGAENGTGTSSVTGYTWLQVADAVDEVQTITITGTPTGGTFTLTLNGETTGDIDWDASAADVQAALVALPGVEDGDVVCTDGPLPATVTVTFGGNLAQTNIAEMTFTDSITGGSPAIATTQDGGLQLSIDGGTSVAIPIGDKTNVAVTNSDGQVLYVDATNINSTGYELVSIPGTHDIFDTLITIRDILEDERGLQLQTLRDNALESLDEINSLLVRTSVSIGSKIGFLNNLKSNLEDIKFDTEDETTRLEEADIAQIAIELSRHDVLYQMSLAVAARMMSMSLLDFIG